MVKELLPPTLGERGAGCGATAEGRSPSEPPQGELFSGSNPLAASIMSFAFFQVSG